MSALEPPSTITALPTPAAPVLIVPVIRTRSSVRRTPPPMAGWALTPKLPMFRIEVFEMETLDNEFGSMSIPP